MRLTTVKTALGQLPRPSAVRFAAVLALAAVAGCQPAAPTAQPTVAPAAQPTAAAAARPTTAAAATAAPKPTTVAQAASGAQTIKIGAFGALTGSSAALGAGFTDGLRLAIKQVNDGGGVTVGSQKYTFDLVLEDYAGAPDQAVTVAQKLVTRDNAKIVFGPEISTAWVAAAKVLQDAKVINFTPTTSAVDFLGKPGGELLFKTHPKEDGPDGRVAGHVTVFVQEVKPKSVAILLPQDPIGPVHTRLYGDALKAAGVEVVYSELFDPNTTDFTPQLTKIRSLKPDALVTGYLDRWMTPLVRQATELGVTSSFLATPGTTLAAADPYKDRVSYVWSITTRNIEASTDPKMQKYSADFKAAFNKDPGPSGFYGLSYYDSVFLLAKALQDAGTVSDLPKIVSAAANVKSYNGGVLGMHFDEKHEAVYTADVGVVRDGKVRYVAGSPS